MSETHEGVCHICGKYCELTFEHIPPKQAFNWQRAKIYNGDEALKRSKGEKQGIAIYSKEWASIHYARAVITILEHGMLRLIVILRWTL